MLGVTAVVVYAFLARVNRGRLRRQRSREEQDMKRFQFLVAAGWLRGWLVRLRHSPGDRDARILASSLVLRLMLLHVLVVGHLLLAGHVARMDAGRTRHVGLLLGIDIVLLDIVWRLGRDLGSLDAVLVAGRFWSI